MDDVILVTGAASGIGRHLVGRFLDRGARVAATDVDWEGLNAAAEADGWPDDRAWWGRLDVSEPEHWRDVVETIDRLWGRIDRSINVAGYVNPGSILDQGTDDIARQVDINLEGTMYGTRIVGGYMVDRGAGHIVNIGSLASMVPAAGLGVYAGTKFGVRGFSLTAAQEFASEGVDVSVVMPDVVDTPMLEKEAHAEDTDFMFSRGEPLSVEDVGDAVERVLEERPLEAAVPSWGQWMARLATVAPGLVRLVRPLLDRLGEKQRREYVDGG
ncbi:MAG: SDR family NAD(P)-dependent oxidoreductase [Bradymonadaceae bacterium]